MTTTNGREKTRQVKLGLFTLDSVNESHAIELAEKYGGIAIASHKLDSLQCAEVDAIIYDCDHLKLLGDPVALIVPGAARLQAAVAYTISKTMAKAMRRKGVIVCRRLATAVPLLLRLLTTQTPAKRAA